MAILGVRSAFWLETNGGAKQGGVDRSIRAFETMSREINKLVCGLRRPA